MSKGMMVALGTLGVVGIVLIIFFSMYVSYNNAESRLRNQINAKQTDNTNQLDNTIKVISQTAQVTQEQMKDIKNIIVGYADARGNGGGSLAKSVHEAIPNIDTKTFENLQNIIVAARNTWTENQRELLDLKREHDNCLTLFPSSFFCGTLGGKQSINVVIVTSSRTQDSFKTGQDNDTSVFQK